MAGPVPCRADATPGPRVSTQHPDHNDRYRRVRQAWDAYQKADQTRTETSEAVTAELVAARADGVTMYRLARWLGVTDRAVQARLEKHDQTNTPAQPPLRGEH